MITERTNVKTAIGINTVRESGENCDSYHESTESVANIPNKRREAMFPMRVVPINQVGLPIKKAMIRAGAFPFCA